MAEYSAYFTTTASATVRMEVPDDIAEQGPDAISEWISSNGSFATLCAHCSGWDKPYSLDLAEWEPEETGGEGEDIRRAYVTDADGADVLDEG